MGAVEHRVSPPSPAELVALTVLTLAVNLVGVGTCELRALERFTSSDSVLGPGVQLRTRAEFKCVE